MLQQLLPLGEDPTHLFASASSPGCMPCLLICPGRASQSTSNSLLVSRFLAKQIIEYESRNHTSRRSIPFSRSPSSLILSRKQSMCLCSVGSLALSDFTLKAGERLFRTWRCLTGSLSQIIPSSPSPRSSQSVLVKCSRCLVWESYISGTCGEFLVSADAS